MATRDRSQGFAFVYSNLAKLLESKEWGEETLIPADAPTVQFTKDALFPVSAPSPERRESDRRPTEQIRENLDRLQTLHQRLHVMLEELNQIQNRKKDPKDEN